MKCFSTGLLLLIVFGSLEGSTIPHKRTVRALNATIQTHFNGTIQRRNPCNDKEVERSSYKGCHEFHHHSKESNWSDYTRKCARLISDFFHAISNLVTFKDRQSGTFDLNINTKVSHKTDGECVDTKKPICPTPTVIAESTDCEVLPITDCDDLPEKDTHIKDSEFRFTKESFKVDEEDDKCSVGSETSVNEEPQTADSSSVPENDKCFDVSYSVEKIPEPTVKTPELQPTQEANPPETKPQSEDIPPETIPNYPSLNQTSETINIEPSVSNTHDDKSASITVKPDSAVPPSTVTTSAPKEVIYIDIIETPQQPTGADSVGQKTPSDTKDYLSDTKSETDEEKTEIQPSSATQPENSNDEAVPEDDDQSTEFSDEIALPNVHEPRHDSFQTFSPSTQHYSSDTTTPSTFKIKSDYDYVEDMPEQPQPTFPPQYQSESVQSGQAVTLTPLRPEPEHYVDQYDQVSSDLPTPFPPEDDYSLEFSAKLPVYNVREPQPESPSPSSLTNEPTSIQPPTLPEHHSENYVNYEDGLASNQLPTSTSAPKVEEPSIELSDQLAVYNVRQPNVEPTSVQPTSSEPQTDSYDDYEDESNESTTSLSPEPSIEFSDQLAIYNIRTPTTTYPPSSVSYIEPSTTQPLVSFETQTANYVNYEDEKQSPTIPPSEEIEPSIEYSDQLAVYNVREPIPSTTTSSPVVTSSTQPSASQPENYMNYENGFVSNQVPTTSSPKHEDEQYLEYSDQLAVYNVREPLPGTTTSAPVVTSSIQPSPSQPENYMNYENEFVSNQVPTTSSPKPEDQQYLEYSDQLAVYNVREPVPSTTTSVPVITSSVQPSPTESDSDESYDDEDVEQQTSTLPSPLPGGDQYLEYSDQLAVYNVREPVPSTTTSSPIVTSSIQPSASQPDSYMNYENEFVPNQVPTTTSPKHEDIAPESQPNYYVSYEDERLPTQIPTTSSPKHEDQQYLEYSDQLAVYNVREPLPRTTTLAPVVTSSVQPSTSQSENYMNYENEFVVNQVPTTSSPKHEDQQYLEYSDQLAVYNVREPVPSTTTSAPLVTSSVQPSSTESDSDESYDDEDVEQQTSTLPSPQPGGDQYLEYSDQLAVYNVCEPLPGTTTPLPVVDGNLLSSFSTTLPPSFPSYELNSFNEQKTEVEPQPTFAPKFEEVTLNLQPFTGQPQSSNEPATEYYGEYNEQTFSNQIPSSTTPAGRVYPTMMPSSEYIDNNGPESQPTSTLRPTEPEQNQVFSDQVSDIREPQSESSVSDGRISDMVTESSISYDDESSLIDSQQTISSEKPATIEYPGSFSTNQPLPNNYEIYDEQSSNSVNEVPMTSTNGPTTYQRFPIDVITTSPSSTEPETFAIYDDPKFSAESQGTYPPKIENESFANYDDYNNTSTTGQASVSIEPLSDNDSSENDPNSSEEGPSSEEEEEEDGNVAVSDDKGLLPLSPNTFRPTVQIETTVNYADQTPFRPIRLPSSIGPLQENNIIYDEGILRNETEPSDLGGQEEANNSLIVPSELTKQNEGKALDSSTTLAPELEFDTYYEETFKQPSSSDAPKTNSYMIYEDDEQPSSPKFDQNATISNDYSTSVFPSTPSFPQQMVTTPSTSDAMPETYSDYGYSKTDFNSQTTFPPQTESVLYDDQPTQDQSLTQQQQQQQEPVDYAAYGNQIQSTSTAVPTHQKTIDFSDELSIYNVPETVLKSSSPSLSELLSSDTITTPQPSTPSDSPSVEPQSYDEQRPLPSKDRTPDTYINYEDTISSSQLPTTPLTPNEVEPSLEYSDQLPVYNVRQPQSESPSSSSVTNEPASVQPSALPEYHSENYVNYEDGLASSQLPTSTSAPKVEEPSIELSDQLAVYNVRQPNVEPTSTEPSPTESDSYDDYEDESNESTTFSSPAVNVEPSLQYSDEALIYNVHLPRPQFSSPSPPLDENIPKTMISTLPPSSINEESTSAQPTSPEAKPGSEDDYDDEIAPNYSPTTLSTPTAEPTIELTDDIVIYDVRQPSTASPPSSVSYLEPTSAQTSVAPESQPNYYASYEDERLPTQIPTTTSPKHENEQYLEYSDQLAVYNVREPLPGTTTLAPVVTSSIQPSSTESDSDESYDDEDVEQQTSTLPSPQPGGDQYLEYSDQLAVYNVREPVPSTTTSSPIVTSSIQPSASQSDSYMNYENEFVPNQVPTTTSLKHEDIAPESQPNYYVSYEDERLPTQIPTTSSPKHEDQQYLEYSDQLAVYNVREPLPGTTTSAPVLTSSIQPSTPQSDNYMNYEHEFVANQVPTTSSPKHEDQQYLEYSDQLAVYNVREPVPSTTTSSPIVTSSIQPSASQSDSYMNYENEFVPNQVPTTTSPKHEDEQYLEYSDQLAAYNVREPLPGTTTLAPVVTSSVQPSSTESDSDESYDDEDVEQQTSTLPSPQPGDEQYLEYSDQLAVYNVREPISSSTTASPAVSENIPSSFVTTLPSLFSSDKTETYDDPSLGNELRGTVAPEMYDQPTSAPAVPSSSTETQPDNYGSEEFPTTSSPPKSMDPFLEYSDELSIYNVRQPEYISSSPSPVSEKLVTTTVPNLPSDDFGTYDNQVEYTDSQSTFPSQSESQTYLEPTSVPSSSVSQSVVYASYDENVRQPYFETTPSSPSETENASSGAMSVSTIGPFPNRDSFQGYNPPVTSSDYLSTSSQFVPESQVNYEDYTVQKEVLPSTPSTLNLAQDFTVPPSNYSAELEFDYHPTSPSQSQDNYINYEDHTVSNALTTTSSPVKEVEPSLEYSDQLAVYNVREPVFESATAPVVSSITTLSPSSSIDILTSTQVSPSESQSDSDDEYEDETVSDETPTTLSTPLQVEPSVEYSDPLAAFNVLGPVILPIPATVAKDNITSGDVTTSSPSSSPQPSSESQSDSYEDYEDETSSTPSPVTGYEPSFEISDEVSIYNVRQRPSDMTTPSPLSENIPIEAVTTYAPYIPSKFESYDYQPAGFESQPTFSPVSKSQLYNEPTSVPSTSSQSQDNYLNYGDEIESNEPMTTLRPSVHIEPSIEYSDGLAVYNVQSLFSPSSSPSPLLNENVAVDTVPTIMPAPVYDAPTSAPSTSSEERQDNYVNYDDQLPSNEFPITYSPAKEEPPMTSSDQLSVYTTTPQSPPSVGYDYGNQFEYTDSQTIVPTEPSPKISNEPTSIRPLTSSESQPEQYIYYEDERPSTSLPTSTSSSQVEPSLEYSDQLAVYNVREPLPGSTTLSPVVTETVPSSVVTTLSPASLSVESISVQPSSESQSEDDEEYEDEFLTTLSPPVQAEPSVEVYDEVAVYNVREPLLTSTSPPVISENVANNVVTTASPSPTLLRVEPISVQPSSESQSEDDEEYEDEFLTTLAPPGQVEPSVEVYDEVAVYNVREPLPVTTTSAPVVDENIANGLITTLPPSPSNLQSGSYSYVDYKDEMVSKETPSTLSTPIQVEPSIEYSDEVVINNVRQPEYSSSSPSPVTEIIASDFQPTSSPQSDSQMYGEPTSVPTSSSESQTDEYINYEDNVVPNQLSSSLSSPMHVEPSLEYSDQLPANNVRQPEYSSSSSSPSPLNEMVTTTAPSQSSDGFGMYDNQVLYTDFQPTSSPQSDSQMYDPSNFVPVSSESQPDNYVNYEDKTVSIQASSTLSPPVQIEPSVEYSDEVAVYNVRDPLFTSTSSPVASENIPSNILTTLPPSPSSLSVEPTSIQPSSSESQSEDDEEYEDEFLTTLSPPVQVEPSVEYSDQLAVYNVREPLPGSTTLPPVVSENILSSEATTPSSSSLIVDQTLLPSSADTQSDSDEDYEDETVSTPSPMTGYEPTFEVTDEFSIYNVRQRPSEMTTPSPFTNNVISNFMTTLSPYFTFEESSLEDNLNTISQTTVPPKYEPDMYDEESSAQPSQSNEDDSQPISDETTSKDFLPETLSNFDEQTISNVIQSTQSPDLSNQLYSENEVEYPKVSFITVQPNVVSSVPSGSTFEPKTEQEFGYQPTFSPDYQTYEEAMTTPPSSRQSQNNYVVYEDQTVPNELTTSSPVNEPSLEYSNQLAVNNALLPETSTSYSTSTPPFLRDTYTVPPSSETYTDYEGTAANLNSPTTLYDEPKSPGQVQTSTSPQPQFVNYDYYNDRNQKPEESSASTPTTEIDTTITLTEFGPTLPPNFESQVFDKSDSVESSEFQPNNYVDYEDSIVTTQMPSSTYPQTDIQPSIESSDELLIYNVRKPYFEPTSIQPSSSFEPQPDHYDIYEDQVMVNELTTPSTSQKIENTVTQPTTAPEEPTQMYDEPTSSPATSPKPQQDNYVNYDNEMISYQPMTSTASPNQVQPSIEYSDEVAVYDVRESLPGTTTLLPVTSENIASSVVTTLPPSSLSLEPISVQPSSETQSESDEDYEDEFLTTLSPPVQVEPSVEYSDQLAIYNVREPLPGTTTLAPVVTSSVQPSTSQSDSYLNYENEIVSNQVPTTSSPKHEDEQYLEYSDQLAVYSVREAVPSTTTSSPLVTSSIQTSSSDSDSDESYDDEDVEQEASTLPSPQPGGDQYLEYSDQLAVYNVREPLPSTTTSSPIVTSSIQPSTSQSDTYINYENEFVPNQIPTTSSPKHEEEQYLEYSDQLAVYNVREPLPEATTLPPVVNENIANSVVTTLPPSSSSLIVEPVSVQPSDTQSQSNSDEEYENETVSAPSPISVQPISIQPSSNVQLGSYAYEDYKDETVSKELLTTFSTPVEVEPSVEVYDEVAVYNVREPLSGSTTLPPVVTETFPSSVVTTLSPPSLSVEPISVQPSSESQLEDDEEYEDEFLTTLSPPVQVEPSVEVYDEVAVYNVREPLPGSTTLPPVVSENILSSEATTPSPSSLIVDQTSLPSSSDTQSDSDEDYDDEIVSTPSPMAGYEPTFEVTDEFSIYNVRQRPSEMTTPSPFNNVISNFMTTISPYFTLAPNDNESSTSQSSVTSEPEPEIYDQPYSTSLSSSESTSNNNVNSGNDQKFTPEEEPKSYDDSISAQKSSSVAQPENYASYEDVIVTNNLPTSLPPTTVAQPSIEYSDELAIYDVRQPSTASPPSSVSYLESSSPQTSIAPESQPNYYDSYEDERLPTQIPTTSSPKHEDQQYLEYSDQLAVYNIRESLPGTTTSAPVVTSSIQPSPSLPENYMNYENEFVSNQVPTTSSPKHEDQQYLEYSDQLAVYNVREPVPSTTTSAPVVTSSIQPSSTESDNDDSYDDEDVEQQTSTLPSPQPGGDQYLEYSDQLAVYNVREPVPSTTTPSPIVTSSTQPSASQSDSYMNYENEFVSNQVPTTSSPKHEDIAPESQPNYYVSYEDERLPTQIPTTFSPKHEDQQYLEYSDQLAVYNVREPLPGTTTLAPVVTSSVQPSTSQSDSYLNYENEIVSNQVPTTSSPKHEDQQYLEYSDQLAVYNVREPVPSTTTSSPLVTSSIQTSSSDSDSDESYDDEDVEQEASTLPSPQPGGDQYLEYSDQLAVYNVREPIPSTTTSSPIVTSSIQPSTSQSDTYINYENEFVPNQIPTTSSPKHEEEQYLEYSDQLAVYNVREPLPSTTTASPAVSENLPSSFVTTLPPLFSSDGTEIYEDPSVGNELQATVSNFMPAPIPSTSSEERQDNYINYDDQLPSNEFPITYSPAKEEPPMTSSDQLSIYTTTPQSPPSVGYDYGNQFEYTDSQTVVPTEPSPKISNEPTSIRPLTSSESQPEQYIYYEDERPSTSLPTSTSSISQVEPSLEYSDEIAVYNVREPLPGSTTIPPVITETIPSSVVTTLSPASLGVESISVQPPSESESEGDEEYEDEFLTTLSPPVQAEPSVEYSDEVVVYNVREPLLTSTSPPLISENVANSVVTALPPSPSSLRVEPISVQPSSSESQSEVDEEYEDEFSTTLSPPVQVEPSVEVYDEVAVCNVREPLPVTTTSAPVVDENIANGLITTLPPSPSNLQSGSYSYVDYKDEMVSKETPSTLSTPIQVEPSIEYSDEVVINNVRQPEYSSSSPSSSTESFINDLVTTVTPSLGGFETYDNQVVYTDFQPTSSPQSDSQMYDEPTSIPDSSSESQKDNYVNYEDKMASNEAVTSASPPVDVDVEYSDEFAIYNVRQPSTARPVLSDITTTPSFSTPDYYSNEMPTSSPVSDNDRSYIFTDEISIVREPQSDSHIKAPNMFTTLPPLPQNPVGPEQNDYYTYDDQTDTQTTFSPETEIEYDEAPTSLEPQSSSSTQPPLEIIVPTFQPQTESQINKIENKTSTPSNPQEAFTFLPLHSFIPLNQPSYPLPEESKPISEQQDQVIPKQVIFSTLVPSSALDSDKQFNYFSNLVQSQDTRPNDGVENIQRDTPQPEPFALVPDQTNPSNEPGEDYVSCTCTRGNGKASQHALMCPFNPVLKGNMTAPSYYILISKLSRDCGNQSLPGEDHFQVEKVYLGDGTPLNCTDERKAFPTSKYTPVPIASARTVKLPIRLDNA